jgi:hypothetical protein
MALGATALPVSHVSWYQRSFILVFCLCRDMGISFATTKISNTACHHRDSIGAVLFGSVHKPEMIGMEDKDGELS